MLNVRALNNLLTENVDNKLFVRWFIMTPNGSLMAYALPANLKELRDQVALVSLTWKDNAETKIGHASESEHHQPTTTETSKRATGQDTLETLTLEFSNRNLIVKELQPKLLLVLEGGVPPGRQRPLKVTAEAAGDARYPPYEQTDSKNASLVDVQQAAGTSPSSKTALSTSFDSGASTTTSAASLRRLSVLQIQRKKLEIMADTIKDELQRSGFEMPDDPNNKYF